MAEQPAVPMAIRGWQRHKPRHLVSPFRPARQLRRIYHEQVWDARAALSAAAPNEEAIHLARKSIKRARATLRLIRGAIGKEAFSLADATLRDAAHSIGPLRDGDVLLRTLEKVIEWGAEPHAWRSSSTLKTISVRADRNSRAFAESIGSASASLDSAATQADNWYVSDSWYSLSGATKIISRRARKASRRTAAHRDERALHALRRKTQCLRHALETIALEPPGIIEKLIYGLGTLSDLLGEDHDLAALAALLEQRTPGRRDVDREALLAVIGKRRAHLQRRALKHAHDIYKNEPSRFAARLEKQWRQWEIRLLH